MIPHLVLLPLALTILFGGTSASPKSASQQVLIDVQVCEAMESTFWFNVDADQRWGACQKPLKGVRLAAGQGGGASKAVETDENGRARLGPITLVANQTFGITMEFTSRRSLVLRDLFVGNGHIQEGQNKLLVYRLPEPSSEATNP